MIKLINVSKTFYVPIFDNINLELPSTGLIIIEGDEKSGKTTLLSLIGSLYSPTEGELYADGHPISSLDKEEVREFREKYVSFVFQQNELLENMTVRDNLNLTNNSQNLESISRKLDIENLLDEKVKDLGEKEKRLTAIARGLMKDAKIVLIDEPFTNLDDKITENLLKTLKEKSQNSLIIVAMKIAKKMEDYADRIIKLEYCRIVKDQINRESNETNKITQYRNDFNSYNFTKNNLLRDTRKIMRNSRYLMFAILFLIAGVSLAIINYPSLHAKTMLDHKDDLLIFNSNKKVDNRSIFLKEDIEELEKKINLPVKFQYGTTIEEGFKSITFPIRFDPSDKIEDYYRVLIQKYNFFDEKNLNEVEYGRKPNLQNEIVITSYLADSIIKFGIKLKDGEVYQPKNYEEMIDNQKEIPLGDQNVKIVGIKKLSLEKYESLKSKKNKVLFENFTAKITNEAGNIYVKNNFSNLYKNLSGRRATYCYFRRSSPNDAELASYIEPLIKVFNTPVELIDGRTIEHLKENEIIANRDFLTQNNLDERTYSSYPARVYIQKEYGVEYLSYPNLKVVGISKDDYAYFNPKTLGECYVENPRIGIAVLKESDRKNLKNIFKTFPLEIDEGLSVTTNYSGIYNYLKDATTTLYKYIFFFAVVLTIFSTIFVYNYAMESTEKHKREISLLKAFGIDNTKITKSFTLELIMTTILSYIFALLSFAVLSIITNISASKMAGFQIWLIPFNVFCLIAVLLFYLAIDFLLSKLIKKKIKNIKPEELLKNTID